MPKKLLQFEKIRYTFPKLKKLNKQIEAYYDEINNIFPLFRALSAHIFIKFRDMVDSNVHAPIRTKNKLSMKKKLKKLEYQLISNILKSECTKDSIDEKIDILIGKITQDIFGLTLVLHSNNNIETTYKDSKDKKIQMLLTQMKTVKQYLDLKPDSKSSSVSFDITSTFIDNSDIGIQNKAPREIPPLSINTIETWEDYYTNLISLLTLLTNFSTPCNYSSDGKRHKYCTSQINFPYLKILEFDGIIDPNDKFKSIKNLLSIAENTYDGSYLPFDEQFDFALKSKNMSIRNETYKKKIIPTDLLKCKIHLQYLNENLQKILNDRLSQYILENSVPNIIEKISSELKELGINCKIISSYFKARSNGYVSQYIVIELENKLRFELQLISEFRYNMGKEGNSAHNISRSNKTINIMKLFESRDPSLSEEDFQILLRFLNSIDYKSLTSYHSAPEDEKNKKILEDLVNYALNQIQLSETIEITDSNGISQKQPVINYISTLLRERAPNQGKISAAHNTVPNEARFTLDDDIQSLQKLLPARFYSVLSHYLIKKYKEKVTLHFRTEKDSIVYSPGDFPSDITAVIDSTNFSHAKLPSRTDISDEDLFK